MVAYKGREVQVVSESKTKPTDQVLVQHVDGSNEWVNYGLLEFSEKEIEERSKKEQDQAKALADQRTVEMKQRQEMNDQQVAMQQEKQKLAEQGKPVDAYLESATYNKNDNVSVDGVTYRSRTSGNVGQKPSADSDYWSVVYQDGNAVPQKATPVKAKPVEEVKPVATKVQAK